MATGLEVGSLVLYKDRPARVAGAGERLQIELAGRETLKVRVKDVRLLHPGPLTSLDELKPLAAEAEAAWEILEGSTTTLADLAELIYGEFTPRTAWAAWEIVRSGAYFRGTPDHVMVATADERAARLAARTAEAARQEQWDGFMERVRSRSLAPGDERLVGDLEDIALGRSARSRILRGLGKTESPEDAHSLLLELGRWSERVNPYPSRLGLSLSPPAGAAFSVPDEDRLDLSDRRVFAIDDDVTGMADDALGFHDGALWVHVADPAAAVMPNDALDMEARGRGSALYLPEITVPMLPQAVANAFGLGTGALSPALSCRVELTDTGARMAEIVPSMVRVVRITYEEAEERLDEMPFASILPMAETYQAYRRAGGAITIALPEMDVRVVHGDVVIRPVRPLRSRSMVQEAMIMAGEAAARWAMERGASMPYACQEVSGTAGEATTLSGMYALRRVLRPRQYRASASRHAALGLDAYVQITSPLRRYLDLAAHQQIRAILAGRPAMNTADLIERVGAVEAVTGALRAAEQLSNRHWTLVYLLSRPGWRGMGSVVDKRGRTAVVLVQDIGLETTVVLNEDLPLDATLPLILMGVRLERLEAHFRVGR